VRHYELLGVSPDASPDEVASAYRHLAKRVHPDTDPSASRTERQARDRAMARLNFAYEVARRDARSRHRASAPGPSTTTLFTPTPPGACDVCGAPGATISMTDLRSAWIRSALPGAPDLELCPECAAALQPEPEPEAERESEVQERVRQPRPKRQRIAHRVASTFVLLALIATGIAVAITQWDSSPSPSPSIGACVQWSGGYEVVDCSQPHTGVIVSTVARSRGCPTGAAFTRRDHTVFCIDTAH
jgi:hypothetical protein